MGRERSLPIFIGNDFEVAQDNIYTRTCIVLHCTSWADTPVCHYIRTSCHTERSEVSLLSRKPNKTQATQCTESLEFCFTRMMMNYYL